MPDDEQFAPGERVAAAMKVSNLLRSADDRALARFAKSHVQSDAVTVRHLRTLRALAERVARLLGHAEVFDLERAERALEVLDEVEPPSSSERPTTPPEPEAPVGDPGAPSFQSAPPVAPPVVSGPAEPSPWARPASALGKRPTYPRSGLPSGQPDEQTLVHGQPTLADQAPEPPTWREPRVDPDGATFADDGDPSSRRVLPFSGHPAAAPPPAVPDMRISPDGGTIQSDVAPPGPALPFTPHEGADD